MLEYGRVVSAYNGSNARSFADGFDLLTVRSAPYWTVQVEQVQ